MPRRPPPLSQPIITTRYEFDESTVTQILKLLTYLGFDVLVSGIEIAKVSLKTINFFKCEFPLTQRLHTFHYVKQPTARFQRLASKEERLLPFLENGFLRTDDPTLDDMNLAGFRHAIQPDF